MAEKTRVYLEIGKKRTFAMALDWPGWGRSGKDSDEALQRFVEYSERYEAVAKQAGFAFSAGALDRPEVTEVVAGSATTDFGAPGAILVTDSQPVTATMAKRQADLVRAAWEVFDQVAAASPQSLRAGPRGAGRDRDKIVAHVWESEATYARKLGIKHRPPALGDREAIVALREAVLAVLGAQSDGKLLTPNGWPVRYASRRIAWHVLDHAWEIEDRS